MASPWAQVVSEARSKSTWHETDAAASHDGPQSADECMADVECGGGGGGGSSQPAAASSSAADTHEEVALFATRPPGGALPTDLQAIAALIDEDDAAARPPAATKRSRASLGTAQVCLALTGLEDELQQVQRQRLM